MNVESDTLIKLAEMAKQVGGDAWPILVKQQYYKNLVDLISGGVLTALFAGLGTPLAVYEYRCGKRTKGDDTFFGIAFIGVAVIFLMINLACNLTPVLYPEGAALEYLIRGVR